MKTIHPSIKSTLLILAIVCLQAGFAQATNKAFNWRNFQSDLAGVARHVDPNLINPWGMALVSGQVWVNDNGAGLATVYTTDGSATSRVIIIPPSASNTSGVSSPTGISLNGTQFFRVTKNANTLPSTLIFVSEDGVISGWNFNLDPINAVIAVDNGASGAVYKGADLGSVGNNTFLFVANFKSGHVEIYDGNFNRVDTPSSFADPNLPIGYAPFNIRNFGNQIFVTYALQDEEMTDDVPGEGNGIINVFDTSGNLVRRLVSNGHLNSPWGLARPNTFGTFKGTLFVGNFGDGEINIYDLTTGNFLATLTRRDGTPLAFDNLWDLLVVGKEMFATAGIADEAHGLLADIFFGKD